MRKYNFLILIIALSFALVACKSPVQDEEQEANVNQQEQEVENDSETIDENEERVIRDDLFPVTDGTPFPVDNTTVESSDPGESVSDEGGESETPPSPQVEEVDSEPVSQEPVPEQVSAVKEFTMTARQWQFEPSTIVVSQGDTVKLQISSIDVKHGIGLPAFEIFQDLLPGQTINIEFVADKKGTFSFFCTVSCGAGHGSMTGTLIVQ